MPGKSDTLSIQPRFRINHGRRLALGPGKVELLEHIDATGSITEAAKAMDMSYMRAWTLLKSTDRAFVEPLVSKLRGGSSRGGAQLTPTGREVIRLYRGLEAKAAGALREAEESFTKLLKR